MFTTFIYNPILQTLLFIYENIAARDLGLAILLLTLLVRIVLYPLFHKSTRDQAAMQKIQPELQQIQKNKSLDAEAKAKAMMELYRTNKVNPISSIFVTLLQLPIFFALFKIMSVEVANGVFDNTLLFGVFNLKEAGIEIALLAAVLQYLQFKIAAPKAQGDHVVMQKILPPVISIATFFILFNLPRALALYWAATTIFSIIQYFIAQKGLEKEKQKYGNA